MRLPSLPLLSLLVLERESRCPLVSTCLPANAAIAASEQNAPKRNHSQEARAERCQTERHDTNLGPHGVAVEGDDRMEDCGYGKGRERVGGLGVFGVGRRSWICVSCGLYKQSKKAVPSESLLESGTEPVSRTVMMPSAMSENPSEREK